MIFGGPEDFNKSITERDIKIFMMKEMNITNTTNFDVLLRDFDKKNETEKAKVLSNLAEIFKAVLYNFTSEYSVEGYMRKVLHITDFSPYEGVLRDFDKKSADEKKKALDQLLVIYLKEKTGERDKHMKNNGIILTSNLLMNILMIFSLCISKN